MKITIAFIGCLLQKNDDLNSVDSVDSVDTRTERLLSELSVACHLM